MPQKAEAMWRKLVCVHNHAKALMLHAEEIDRNFENYLQPTLEQKHAYEHVARARAAELEIREGADEAYIIDCLRKALGHEYRAFFDVADWVGVRIREIVMDLLHPFTNECISEVLPEYYKEMKPKIEWANKKIAEIRNEKDVSQNEQILPEINEYRAVIGELLKMQEIIAARMPSLVEYAKKERQGRSQRLVWEILLGVFTAAVGVFITWLCMR